MSVTLSSKITAKRPKPKVSRASAVILSSKSKEVNSKLKGDEERIKKSLKHFQITSDSESKWRKQALEDIRFAIGTGQWDAAVKANREIEGKPCLTVNRAWSFLRQFTGDERQHRPSMIVNPVGSGADIEVAKIHQGVLRHVETASFADITYDDSYQFMMIAGACPWRVKTDYVTPMSFRQEPRIEPFDNPLNCYISPVRNAFGQDPLWTHIIEDLSKEQYKAKYPKSLMTQLNFPTDSGSAQPGWVTKHGARVAEYWWIELQKQIICQLSDGSVKLKKNCSELELMAKEDERETVIRKVRWIKHNAIEILDTEEYVGSYIPVVDLFGVRLNVNGEIYKAGIIRDYRDAQRMYDFHLTRMVEQMDAQGKDPLFVPMGATENFEEFYRLMNRKNFPYVPYQPFDKQDRPLPPPSRANRNVDLAGLVAIVKQADYDMGAVMGIYGPRVDKPDPMAESGVALMTRQQQSDTGMVSLSDNLNRAIRWQGVILVDIWPKYITEPQLQRMVKPDDSIAHTAIFNSQLGGQTEEDAAGLLDGQAIKKAYDVGVGEYDITLSTGPMNQTARQEGFKALTYVIGQPAIAQSPAFVPILHLWARNGDFAGSDELAKIFKKMIPPQFQDADPADKDAQLAQQAAALQQLTQQHQQLVAELARASDAIRTKRLDVESRERVANLQAQTQLALQMMKTEGAASTAHVQAIFDAINHRLELLHESMSIEQDAGAAGPTPELPGQVEPKVQPITPAAPTVPVPGSTG